MKQLIIIPFLVWFFDLIKAGTIQWIADSISHSSVTKNFATTVKFTANGDVYNMNGGQFRFYLSVNDNNYHTYIGATSCMPLNSGANDVSDFLNNMFVVKKNQLDTTIKGPDTIISSQAQDKYTNYGLTAALNSIFSVSVKKYYQSNTAATTTILKINFTLNTNDRLSSFNLSLGFNNCSPIKTIGLWSDSKRWNTGRVPTKSDDVVIPSGSGYIQLTSPVTVGSLSMSGGSIIALDTSCPIGWSVDPRSTISFKCYKVFTDQLLSFSAANRVCQSSASVSSPGTLDARLIQIENRVELITAQRLCRPSHTYQQSSTNRPQIQPSGCWIGLWDPQGSGNFDWVEPVTVSPQGTSNVGNLFYDWRRNEPNNHTISKGVPTNGELCVELVAWEQDPLIVEQGSWNDDGCEVQKPFICQIFKRTVQFTFAVQGLASISGGDIQGGILTISGANSNLNGFAASRSAQIVILAKSNVRSLQLTDGATLRVQQPANLFLGSSGASSVVGEPLALNSSTGLNNILLTGSMQPALIVDAGATVTVQGSTSINARASILGNIIMNTVGTFSFFEGAELSQATATLSTPTSMLALAGYSSRLAAYDSFELSLSNTGTYLGEYYRDFTQEFINAHQSVQKGVYRLKAQLLQKAGAPQQSACIPYNATTAELTKILNSVPLIKANGGVTVRRFGQSGNSRFGYGFTYRIEMDAVPTASFSAGAVDLSVACYGLACGCAEVKVPMINSQGDSQCLFARGNVSQIDPFACALKPSITVSRISFLGYSRLSGQGALQVSGGVTRLPPLVGNIASGVTIACVGNGKGVVAADVVSWYATSVSGSGSLVVAGTGWTAWDSSWVLYAPEWTHLRGFVSALDNAPAVSMSSQSVVVKDAGQILGSCPNSVLTWTSTIWAGGVIGGRVQVSITKSLLASGPALKTLRFGTVMMVKQGAVLTWQQGNIALADGANLTVYGSLLVNNAGYERVFIGEAQLLLGPSAEASGRDWHGYFDRSLPAELRHGWYDNPLCGGNKCAATNQLQIVGSGTVECSPGSSVTLSLPLDLVDNSVLKIGSNVNMNLASGGVCGNKVVINIASGTVFELSGGEMLLGESCTIQGQGEMLVSAGVHDMSFSIDAHITIAGGALLWPFSRGPEKSITFSGGLLLKKTGQLIVEPYSTQITILKEVILMDECLVQFPLLGIAAQASPFDEQDAPDKTPRGSFNAKSTMIWAGGTLKGKADFNALLELYLDSSYTLPGVAVSSSASTRNIQSLAKLVNRGHCEWGEGDLTSSDQGDFLNFGTIQMMNGVNAFGSNLFYKGTELPIENGGDVFALDYHTWDMDQGSLNYDEYVRQRIIFVSAPATG